MRINGFQGNKRISKKTKSKNQDNRIDLSLTLAPPGGGDGGGGNDWTITKQLTRSDVVSRQNRLLIARDEAQRHILDYLDNNEKQMVYDNHGCPITVVDIDTQEEFTLKFAYWKSTKSYMINGKWHKSVVTRRKLEKEEGSRLATVGLRWDRVNKKLLFSVLKDPIP